MTFRAALNGRWLGQHSDEVWLDDVDIVGNGQSAPALGANGWAANFTKVALTRSTVKDERGCAFLADYVTEASFWKAILTPNASPEKSGTWESISLKPDCLRRFRVNGPKSA
jgi:hypothetical protein